MATNIAQLVVGITSDTRGLIAGIGVGQLAIAAFAAAAINAALQYDRAFTQIAAVSNASAADVAKWRDEVKALSGETARSPQELADALYFLASAGLDANQVMPALEASAKAAAVGLGETADVAKIVAQVLNAYADSGLEAVDVTDTLVAAVREGTAAPEEFAGALGRILPIASAAGVSFDEVAASLASLSNIGLDVNEGVTAMRGLLQALEAPGSQAAETLGEIGISAERMRDVISEGGILGALRLLESRTGGNIDTLRKIIPNIRALTGLLGLTTQEARKVNAIFERVKDSSGALNTAFNTLQQSSAFKVQKAINEIRLALLELGEAILPALGELATAFSDVLEAIGPNLEQAFERLSYAMDLAATVAGFLAGNMETVAEKAGDAGDSIKGFFGNIIEGIPGGGLIRGFFDTAVSGYDMLVDRSQRGAKATDEFAEKFADQIDAIKQGTPAYENLRTRVTAAFDSFLGVTARTRSAADGVRGVADALQAFLGVAPQATNENNKLARSHDRSAAAARNQRAAELALVDPLFAVLDSADQLQEAQAEVNRLRRKGRLDTEKGTDAVRAEFEAYVQAQNDLLAYGTALDESGKSHRQVVQDVRKMGKELGLTKEDVRGVISELNNIPAKVRSTVIVDKQKAEDDIVAIESRMNQLVAHDWELRVAIHEVRESPTPTELIAQLDRDLRELTSMDWMIGIGAGAGALSSPTFVGALSSPEMVGAAAARTNVEVTLDRRRFTETTDYDARYRGF